MSDISLERGRNALDKAASRYVPLLNEEGKVIGGIPLPPVTLTRASDIEIKPIDWLWRGFLPTGMFVLLAGAPGCGKSTLTLALAATVTSAGRWPDGTPMRQAGSVLIWSAEDAPDTVLAPRLAACGADLSRVHFIESTHDANGERRAFDPATDMPLLRSRIESMSDVKLLILDPILNAVRGDSNAASDTRRGLHAVVELATERGICVLGISHFRKGSMASDPAERVLGSGAFVALARVVLVASKVQDPDDPKSMKRIVAIAKSNISADSGGFEFFLEQTELRPGISAQRITWGGAVDGSALELLNRAEGVESEFDDAKNAIDNACDFIRESLGSQQRASKELEAEARSAGISTATFRRARSRMNVRSVKSKLTGEWFVTLPNMLNPEQNVHTESDEHLEHDERLQAACGFAGDKQHAQTQTDEHLQNASGTSTDVEGAQDAQDAHVVMPGRIEQVGASEKFDSPQFDDFSNLPDMSAVRARLRAKRKPQTFEAEV